MTTSINKNSLLISSNQSTKTLVFNPSDYTIQTEYDTQAIQCLSPLPTTYKFLQYDGFFTLEKGTNLLSYYHWNKKFPISKFSVNEELLSIIISTSGEYLIGGGLSGQLYIWQIETGRLVNQLSSHKKSITSLKITKDGRWLATGSSDSAIKVYSFYTLLTSKLPSYKPQYSLPHHSLSITDLHIGTGNIHHSKLYSSSVDNSLQIHQLSTGQLLADIEMPNIINTFFVDILERYIYCGLENCQIVILDSRCNFEKTTLIGHSHPITCLYLSIDGTKLFSGDKGGFLLEWDLSTKKLANSVQLFKDQPITQLVHIDVPFDSEFAPAPFQKTPSIGKFQASIPNFYPANFEDDLPTDFLLSILNRHPLPYDDKSNLFPNKQNTESQKEKLETKLNELSSDFEALTLKYMQAKSQSNFFEDKN